MPSHLLSGESGDPLPAVVPELEERPLRAMVLQRLHDVAVDFAGQAADLTVVHLFLLAMTHVVAAGIVGAEQLCIIDVIVVSVFHPAAVTLAGHEVVEIYVFVVIKLDIATLDGIRFTLGVGLFSCKILMNEGEIFIQEALFLDPLQCCQVKFE